jgi:acetylornithine deacetylase/succinyl-diaminopimelate desuccinylase-like protein
MPEIGAIGKEKSTMPPLQGRLRRAALLLIAIVAAAAPSFSIAAPPSPDWSAVNKEALDYFRTYLRFDTTNPPDNTAQAIGFLKGILDREGIETATFESKPGAMSLVARLPGPPGRKPFLLLSHVDVVPAVASDWSHPPFSADLADGYVWGRGAIDNKAHGIMALMTMLELKRNHVPLRRGVVMMVNADEEAGGANGAQWMAANHWNAFDPAFAINEGGIAIPDPFGSRGNVFEVSVAEKRVMWLKVTAHGHSGHGSIPRSDNPTLILINALARLLAAQPDIRLIPIMSDALSEIAPREAFPTSFELGHLGWPFMIEIAMRGPLKSNSMQALLRDTISPTTLSGSLKVNVIPSIAEAGLDCRLLPGTDADQFLRRIRNLLADDRISIEFLQIPDTGPVSPTSGEAWDAIRKVIAQDFPDTIAVPWMTTGGTDSRFLREKGVPAYGFVPIVLDERERERVHGVDERLSVDNLNLGVKATWDLTMTLCAGES